MEKIRLSTLCFLLSTLLLCLSLLLSLTPVYAQTESGRAVQYLYKIAEDYYSEGDYKQALHEFKKILLIEPGHKGARRYIELISEIKKQKEMTLRERVIVEAVKEAEEILRAEEEVVIPEKISFDEMTEIPSEKRKAIIEALNEALAPVKVSGEYQVSMGLNSKDDFIWKDAYSNLAERNKKFLFGEARENTFDSRIYDRLYLDIDTEESEGWNFHSNITIDPWSFVGTSPKTTISGTNGDEVEVELKYWSGNRSTIEETIWTKENGDTIGLPEIKVVDGESSPARIQSEFTNVFNIPTLDINERFLPIRELWIDYTKDDLFFRVFPIAYQNQALTSDDPLGLSNHHIYWEPSPWLNEWKPGHFYTGTAQDFRVGEWSYDLAFTARDSEMRELIFLRGLAFEGELFENTSFQTTVATPMNPWQDYGDVNSTLGAVRLKHQLSDRLSLGEIYTFRLGFDGNNDDASNQVLGLDVNYKLPYANIAAEVATSNDKRDTIDEPNSLTSKSRGNAFHVAVSTDKPLKEEDKKSSLRAKVSYTHMDEGFDPGLANYQFTRRDEFWGKHIHFEDLSHVKFVGEELAWSEIERYRIGDGIDVGRDVVSCGVELKGLLDDRLDSLFDFRNAHNVNGKYIESVFRTEATYRPYSKLTSRFLFLYQDLPKTKGNTDPFIVDDATDTPFENNQIVDGRDPSIATYSTGFFYDMANWLALEGIYERTNEVPNFPRGLLDDPYISTSTSYGMTIRDQVPLLYQQGIFPLPPYPYYDIYKARFHLKPFPSMRLKLEYVKNNFKHAAGIDDNINHYGLEADYKFNEKLSCALKYTHSQFIDLFRQQSNEGLFFDAHDNIFAQLDYSVTEDSMLTVQFGEFGFVAPGTEISSTPYGWALPTVDTQHLIRLFYTGKF